MEKLHKQLNPNVLSTIVHELKTPLTSIKAFTQLLLSEPDGELKSRVEFLNIINSEVDRLIALIDNLLEPSMIEGE